MGETLGLANDNACTPFGELKVNCECKSIARVFLVIYRPIGSLAAEGACLVLSRGWIAVFASVGALAFLAGCAATGGSPDSASTMQRVREGLDSQWELVAATDPTLERPEVELVRLVSPEEWPRVIADCLRTQAFPEATVTPDGGVTPGEIAREQLGAYQIANYTCNAMFPLDPKYSEPLDDAQLRMLYDHYAGPLTACLEGLGLSVGNPPSFELFVETFTTESTWNPVALAVGTSARAYEQVYAECVITPAGLYG